MFFLNLKSSQIHLEHLKVNQNQMQDISGKEKGESVAMLLSPCGLPPFATANWSRYSHGSLFTMFLTAPLQAFCILLGLSCNDIDTVLNNWPHFIIFVFLVSYFLR